MSNAVREALAEAQRLSAANNNALFELHIQLHDGTDIHGVPYPMEPGAIETVRLKLVRDPPVDPTVPPTPPVFPPESDRWISTSAVLWVEIEWDHVAPPPEGGEGTPVATGDEGSGYSRGMKGPGSHLKSRK